MKTQRRSMVAGIALGSLTLLTSAVAVPASAATAHNSAPIAAVASSSPTLEDGSRPARRQDTDDVAPEGAWYHQVIGSGAASCPAQQFCIWEGVNYTGAGLAISGNWGACEAFSWQGSIWENHAYSVKNNATGGVSTWNRRAGGGLIFDWLHDLVPGAYSGNFPDGRNADLVAYDPSYTCTTFPTIYSF